MTRQETGQRAEAIACRYLQKHGLKLVEKNYRCRLGEIDLIMRDGEDLVFVEVRYRKTRAFGGAAASVDRTKRNKLIATATHYLQAKDSRRNARFDIIAIEAGEAIEWIPNAFDAG